VADLLEVFTGDDWDIQFTVNKNKVVYDVSTATDISASIVDSDGINPTTIISAVTCSSGATGADWANGVVIIEIPNGSTGVDPQNAYVELQVTLASKKSTWPRQNIVIKKGTIA